MDVILLEKTRNLGNLGDQVKVKAGYGHNFLIPQGKAVAATKENIEKFEAKRAELEKAADEKLKAAQARAKKLEALTVTIEANASDEGKLFGSVGPNEIVDAINAAGGEVHKKDIQMPEGPIHNIGEHEVDVQLHTDISVKVKVAVKAA